jgi:hypothetical protein
VECDENTRHRESIEDGGIVAAFDRITEGTYEIAVRISNM